MGYGMLTEERKKEERRKKKEERKRNSTHPFLNGCVRTQEKQNTSVFERMCKN